MTLRSFRRGYERFLEWICIALMVALAAEVTAGVVFRYSGHSLVWYDEVATILLAWVTFYGSALAVLKHAHMGVPEIVRMLPPGPRVAAAVLAQLCTMAFFVLLAWVGYSILEILATRPARLAAAGLGGLRELGDPDQRRPVRRGPAAGVSRGAARGARRSESRAEESA